MKRLHASGVALGMIAMASTIAAGEVQMDKRIDKDVMVKGTLAEVWHAWTIDEGVRTFFAPGSNVHLAIGGPYEIYFAPDAPAGQRGGDGLKVLSYLPQEMLSFEWNFPPSIPSLRDGGARTWVVVSLAEAGAGQVRVRLAHLGWRAGDDWEKGFAYFQRAWDIVLGRLQRRFAQGPIDWAKE